MTRDALIKDAWELSIDELHMRIALGIPLDLCQGLTHADACLLNMNHDNEIARMKAML